MASNSVLSVTGLAVELGHVDVEQARSVSPASSWLKPVIEAPTATSKGGPDGPLAPMGSRVSPKPTEPVRSGASGATPAS